MAKIAILLVGAHESPVMPSLLKLDDVEFDIICNNILDFELPPIVENASPIWHRLELRNILNQIDGKKFTISESLKNLLNENDMLDLSEEYLGITSHINQIEQNSKDLMVAYDLLIQQADRKGLELIPLVPESGNVLVHKNKKTTPLRYYQLKEEMLDMEAPKNIDKKKLNSKELFISDKDKLKEIKLSERSSKVMNEADLIIILPTDLISLAILVFADELEKQIKHIQTPLVLLWPFNSKEEGEEDTIASEILQHLGYDMNIDSFASELSFLTDYVIIPKTEKEQLATLREFGCHVLTSQLMTEEDLVHSDLLITMLRVASLEHLIEGSNGTAKSEIATDKNVETENGNNKDEEAAVEIPTSGKKISQLTESPEEAGRVKEKIDLKESDSEEINEILNDINKRENEIDEERLIVNPLEDDELEAQSVEVDTSEDVVEISTDPLTNDIEEDTEFKVREEEDWIDTVKRAIEQSFGHGSDEALQWLINQSGNDSDREMQIAELAVSAWVESRSTTDRKLGAEIISTLAKNHLETYVQILQRQMIQTVKEKQEDKRRRLIPLFHIIRDVDIVFSEQLIRALTKDLGIIGGEDELAVIETAKLTLLQLVLQSRRLTRISIQELLNILDTKTSVGPEIWNILVAFDAGSISIELVTNFSVAKAEEIIRRSNLLRFTGSYYSTINKVIQAWKDGDKAAIATATGTILPEETLRKFDRLELARKLEKLKMVQLTTLAESLGKDTETVERLITELIVNDELKAEMKLIDDKMYLVSDQIEKSGK